ncbi:MAG TPA: Zeta toxin family protein [Planctomycetaceae bacterium]|nr:Zeta toxin family protein [Planctomycetaceae bacterium]|tara:strand:+ start:226 stop:813 length:588 start_codon:yes stop_codon:yes gene_type:complete
MTETEKPPTVYVIAGPNGAGKTTFATKFLPQKVSCTEFLNADLIAAGLSPFNPESQNFTAGRLFLRRIEETISKRIDFSFETTLSGRGYIRLFKKLRLSGYRIVIFFLWVPSPELAVARVKFRVLQGGHDIPESDIRRRYIAGLQNFDKYYQKICDEWQLYLSSSNPPLHIAYKINSNVKIIEPLLFSQFQDTLR